MKWQKFLSVILLSFILVSPLSAIQFNLKSILPEKMEDQGWIAEEEPFIAVDERSLSMMINGAAPRYIKLGTQKAAFVNYEKKQVYLMLEIYETDSIKSAEKLFDEFKTSKSKPLNNLGTQSRVTSEMGGSYMAEYIQDKFYVKLSITKKSEEAKESILKCAGTISEKISRYTKSKV